MARSTQALFELSRVALGTTQVGLGEMVGVARRTAQRWARSGVPTFYLPKLAALVYPRDAPLAAEIAEAAGKTLVALGIERPPPPPPPPAPLPPPPPPPLPDGVVDSIVCACAEAMDMMPRDVRAGLLAAFARATELGIDVQKVERVLRAAVAPAKGAPVAAKGA